MDIRPLWSIAPFAALLFAGVAPAVAGARPPHASTAVHLRAAATHHAAPAVHRPTATASSVVAPGAVHRPLAIAQADGDEKPDDRERPDHARNAGIIEGQVISVDYQRGMIGLLTPDRGRVDVMVLPSTNIQGRGDGFHTIADIGRGSRLRVFLSQRAGQFFAQIIHLR